MYRSLVVRVPVAIGCAFAGVVAVSVLTIPLPAVVGRGDHVGIILIALALVGAGTGIMLSLRIPGERLGISDDGGPPPSVTAVRAAVLVAGAFGQLAMIQDGLGGLGWMVIVGLVAVLAALPAVPTNGARAACVPLVGVVGTLFLVTFPLYSVGLLFGPATLALLVGSLLPAGRRGSTTNWGGDEAQVAARRALATATLVLLGVAVVVLLSRATAASG